MQQSESEGQDKSACREIQIPAGTCSVRKNSVFRFCTDLSPVSERLLCRLCEHGDDLHRVPSDGGLIGHHEGRIFRIDSPAVRLVCTEALASSRGDAERLVELLPVLPVVLLRGFRVPLIVFLCHRLEGIRAQLIAPLVLAAAAEVPAVLQGNLRKKSWLFPHSQNVLPPPNTPIPLPS